MGLLQVEPGGSADFDLDEFQSRFGLVGEIYGQSEEDSEGGLPGTYGLAAATARASPLLRFDAGLRVGAGGEVPRVGVLAGLTTGVVLF